MAIEWSGDMPHDIIVVGGGLSGLTFAYHASLGKKKVLLLEKQDRLGGCINTIFPYSDSNFFLELGSHTIYSSYSTIINIIKQINLNDNILPQLKLSYRMWEKDKLTSLFSQASILGILAAPFKAIGLKKRGLSVKEYYSKLLGEKNYYNLVLPMTSAVICQDTTNVAADLLLKSRPKDKSMPRSFTMKKGMMSLMDAIGETNGIEVKKGVEVKDIRYSNGQYMVESSEGSFTAPKLALATSAIEASGLLKSFQPEISEILNEIPMHDTKAVALSTSKKDIGIEPFSYAIVKDKPCRAVVSRDVVYDEAYRGMTFHFKPEAELEDSLKEIRKTFTIDDKAELSLNEYIFKLPELRVEHHKRLAELHKILEKIPDFYLLGNYFAGLSMEDCAIRAQKLAEEALGN